MKPLEALLYNNKHVQTLLILLFIILLNSFHHRKSQSDANRILQIYFFFIFSVVFVLRIKKHLKHPLSKIYECTLFCIETFVILNIQESLEF